MIDTLRRNPLIVALALACVVLAAVVAAELIALGRASKPAPAARGAPAPVKLLPQVAAVAPEAAYPETAARPLWIPTRRPAPPPVAAQPSFARGQFILQGVTIAGATRIALLKEKASGRIHRVEKGRDLNGLQVAEVEAERVVLAQGAEREVLDLSVQRPGAPTGGPTPAPPPAGVPGGPFASPPAQPPRAAATAAAPAAAAPQSAPGPVNLQIPPGPLPPGFMPSAPPQTAGGANPSPGTVPQQQPAAAPMTPEELLARRRARRNQSP